MWERPQCRDGWGAKAPPTFASLRFLVADDEMNDAVWRGHEEPIEIFSQLFDFIPPRDTVYFEK